MVALVLARQEEGVMSYLCNRDIVTWSELVNERMASTSARKSASVCREAASNAPRRSKRTFGP